MHSAEDIEIQLWEYIDHVCDDDARLHITNLIATDSVWKQKYAELTALNSSLQQLEPEHTSMRFTKNVMEALATAHVAKPTRSYINKWVVRGIAAVFAILLAGVIIYCLLNLQWTSSSQKEAFNYSLIFNSNFTIGVILLNVLLLIVFFETLFRRRRLQNK